MPIKSFKAIPLIIFVLITGGFLFSNIVSAAVGYSFSVVPPFFGLASTLSSDQNTLTYTASGRSGYTNENCGAFSPFFFAPNGSEYGYIGGRAVLDPYIMAGGTASVVGTSISGAISATDLTQVAPGRSGTPCNDPSRYVYGSTVDIGQGATFTSTAKTLDVSSLSNGNYTLSVNLCAQKPPANQSLVCSTRNYSFSITSRLPTASLSVSPSSVTSGGRSTLTWSSTNATSCTAGGPWSNSGTLSGSGLTNTITSDSTFTFQCTGPGGTTPVQTAVVTIVAPTSPSCTITATPSTIIIGGTSVLNWSCKNVSSVNMNPGNIYGAPSTYSVKPTKTTMYTVTYAGTDNTVGTTSTTVTVNAVAPTATISVSPSTVTSGDRSTLTWSSTNVTSCTASGPWSNAGSLSGSGMTDPLSSNTTFTFQCTGPGGTTPVQTASVKVIVPFQTPPAPVVTISASPSVAPIGGTSVITWNAINATQGCTASGDWSGPQAESGTYTTGALSVGIHTYTLACTGGLGRSGSGSVTVTVAPGALPIVNFSALPSSIIDGGSTTLSWSSTGASSCSAFGNWSGAKATSGSQKISNISPSGSYLYGLNCTGPGGSGSNSATVLVKPSPVCSNGANNFPSCDTCSSTQTWDSSSLSCVLPLGILVSPTTYAVTLPSSTVNATYTFTNGTLAGTNCRLLDGVGTPLGSYTRCTGGISVVAPTTAGNYGYSIQASKASTGEVIKSAGFTVTISPVPACSNGANNPTACNACTAPNVWNSSSSSCILPVVVSASLTAATSSSNVLSQSSCNGTNITWNTDTLADSYVKYSINSTLAPSTMDGNGTRTLSHLVSLTGLTSATPYYYEVMSTDAYGQQSVDSNNGSYYTFTTLTCPTTTTTTTSTQTPSAPVVTISASPTSVPGGGLSTITWSATNATQGCTASGDWSGTKATSGTYSTGALSTGTHTFALVCTGDLGVIGSGSVSVSATSPIIVTGNGDGSATTTTTSSGSTTPGTTATSTVNGVSGNGGGSGGGGGINASGGSGTTGQGTAGGSGTAISGGGGGGSSGPGSSSGAGGAGTSNSITGTPVVYAAGGAGAAGYTGVGLSGGANTGNGSSAGSIGYPGGNGGSGVVIIAYQTGTIVATGGVVTIVGSTTIHTFINGGDFVVTSGSGTVEVLVIAGGGGGAGNGGGGGGAGGYLYESSHSVSPQTYTVTVGNGGAGGDGQGSAATDGGNSSFDTMTAIGGGAGGANTSGGIIAGGMAILNSIIAQTQKVVSDIVPQVVKEAVGNVALLASDVIVTTKEGIIAFNATPVGSATIKTVTATGVVGGGAVAAASATGSVTAFSDITLLIFRLWSLILVALGLRKRRVPWGTVYDSVTKQPLDPAYVVLEDQAGKEVATAITDLDGRFGFLVPPGSYKIIANKSNYSFPSKKLAGKSSDELYDNLYFDGEVALKVNDVITKNIPMDPEAFDWNEFAKRDKKLMMFYSRNARILTTILTILFYVGLVVALGLYLSRPDGLNLAIVIIYGLLLLLRMFVIKPKSFGVIVDAANKEPLSFAVVRVYQKGVDREMFHRVADQYGRYYALLTKGEYYVTIERKNVDGTYTPVFTSTTINAKKGIINADFSI